tara:strand:+ start:14738 stop:15010 length:273 start_codon:yes stop_codon:yes gene_type:complete
MTKETKELKLSVILQFSEVAIEESIDTIAREIEGPPFMLELTVSVFDAVKAMAMMVGRPEIRRVHITKEFHEGRYCLEDTAYQVMVTSHD